MSARRRAADALVELLAARGLERVYCVAGESYLALLDALYEHPSIGVVTCRHESGAAFMALAEARLTGRAGVCLVNRGPGAMNAAVALHSAEQDATPLVLFVGHVRRGEIGRRSFQEIDYARTFGDVAKGVWSVYDERRLPEMAARAFRAAESGTPGPAVVVLPEDLLDKPFEGELPAPVAPRPAQPDAASVADVAARLARAVRPLLVAGGRLAHDAGRAALVACAERWGLPVAASNKHQDLFPNLHPHYAGHLNIATRPAQAALMGEADLVLAVGTRLDEVTTQRHTLPRAPRPRQALVHVYPDAARLGLVYETELALACDPAAFLDALRGASGAPPAHDAWLARLHGFETAQATRNEPPCESGVDLGLLVTALTRLAGDDAVVAVDAGNFTSWVHRYFRFGAGQRLLGIGSSAMGFGVPAGVAAALCAPGRQVFVFVGDGGFLMTGNELATAVQYAAPVRIVVADNGSYGTIRHHQERAFPGRVVATELRNPDFAALARSFSALGLSVECEAEVEPALRQALAHPGPVVLHVRTSLERISAYGTLAAARASSARIV